MSMRRPRIKAAAILPPKRAGRDGIGSSTNTKQPKTESKLEGDPSIEKPLKEKVLSNYSEPSDIAAESDNSTVDRIATKAVIASEEVTGAKICDNGDKLFKCPPVVVNRKRDDSFSALDIEGDRLDDGSNQDYSRNLQGPLSPIKFRQRIRPTPFFGMRRNSTQGYGSDMEEEPKRQRHTSTSSNTGAPMNARIRPPIGQRTRTESSCSNFSDYSRDQNVKPTRKAAPSEEYLRAITAKKEYLSRFYGKIPDKSHMKMSDLIYYNPTTNPMTTNDHQKSEIESNNAPDSASLKSSPVELVDPAPREKETCMPVPQLKLGPNGEMILDEQSLVIETTAEKEARATLAKSNVIFMDEFSGNNGFYRRTKRTKDWSSDETIKFYRCLHTVGTDFSLMLTLFPNRSRRDLKLKFKKEERLNLNLINKALLHPKAFNIADLKQELDKEQQEYDAKQKEWNEIKKQVSLQRKKKTKLKAAQLFSKSARTLTNGDYVYENEVISPTQSAKCNQPAKNRNEASTMLSESSREEDYEKSLPSLSLQIDKDCSEIGGIVKCDSSKSISHKIQNKCSDVQGSSSIRLEEPQNESQSATDTLSKPIIIRSIKTSNHSEQNNHITVDNINENAFYITSDSNTEDYTHPVMKKDIEILYEILTSQIESPNLIKNNEIEQTIAENVTIPREVVESEINEERMTGKIENNSNEDDPSLSSDDMDIEMEKFMQHDLGNILANLMNGSLVVVASEDETDSSKMINEIYVMCKETGKLSNNPLDLPEDIVNCIIEELNAN